LDKTLPPPKNNYILLNESLDYTANYTDIELDPKNASKWKFIHDPDYYTNSLGPIRDDVAGAFSGVPNQLLSGIEISKPITTLDKVGKFEVEYRAQDLCKNHPNFQNYWRWSSSANTTLYVHRRPIASFNYTASIDSVSGRLVPLFIDNSYDLDHTDILSKGIVERKWQYRKENELLWTNGQPDFLEMGKRYAISLEVKDMEGVWSNPVIQTIDTNNIPPDITADPNTYGPSQNDIFITLTASDPEGKIKSLRYTTSNSTIKPSTWNVNNTYNPMTSPRRPGVYITQEGEWYLHAEAEDDLGQKTYKMFGPYIIEGLSIYDFTVSTIYDLNWREYYFDLNKPIDQNGDGQNDGYIRKENTEIKTDRMPINTNGLIDNPSRAIKAGVFVEGTIRIKSIRPPSLAKLIFTYRKESGEGIVEAVLEKLEEDKYHWEFTVPRDAKQESIIYTDVYVEKDLKIYGNEKWTDTWQQGNNDRATFFIKGDVLNSLRIHQSN
jgi:hypothetical protein